MHTSLIGQEATKSSDPLKLLALIEKTVLGQTEQQYPYVTVSNQQHSLFSFMQHNLTNAQYYAQFNTKVHIGKANGMDYVHPVLIEFEGRKLYDKELEKLEYKVASAQASEVALAYQFLHQASADHSKLKTDLQDVYTKNSDEECAGPPESGHKQSLPAFPA